MYTNPYRLLMLALIEPSQQHVKKGTNSTGQERLPSREADLPLLELAGLQALASLQPSRKLVEFLGRRALGFGEEAAGREGTTNNFRHNAAAGAATGVVDLVVNDSREASSSCKHPIPREAASGPLLKPC